MKDVKLFFFHILYPIHFNHDPKIKNFLSVLLLVRTLNWKVSDAWWSPSTDFCVSRSKFDSIKHKQRAKKIINIEKMESISQFQHSLKKKKFSGLLTTTKLTIFSFLPFRWKANFRAHINVSMCIICTFLCHIAANVASIVKLTVFHRILMDDLALKTSFPFNDSTHLFGEVSKCERILFVCVCVFRVRRYPKIKHCPSIVGIFPRKVQQE